MNNTKKQTSKKIIIKVEKETFSNCCGASVDSPDKNGHGRCEECGEGCISE